MHDLTTAVRSLRLVAGDQQRRRHPQVVALAVNAPRYPEWKCPRCGARKRLRRRQPGPGS